MALTQITPQLYYGNLDSVHQAQMPEAAIIHACKEPCHKQAVGYSHKLEPTHPHYLSLSRGNQLYLNMIDPPLPLFSLGLFNAFFAFVEMHLHQRPLLIHCNQGMSRAPSLALLVMAKRLSLLPNESYETARAAFAANYPYCPGKGISLFLSKNWSALGC